MVSSGQRRIANPDAIGRPVNLLTDGLHALFTLRLWSFMVSDCAMRRHCRYGTYLMVPTARFVSWIGDPKTSGA